MAHGAHGPMGTHWAWGLIGAMETHGAHGDPWGPMGTHVDRWGPMGTHGDPLGPMGPMGPIGPMGAGPAGRLGYGNRAGLLSTGQIIL